jgi:hypothetical protein
MYFRKCVTKLRTEMLPVHSQDRKVSREEKIGTGMVRDDRVLDCNYEGHKRSSCPEK